MKTLPILLLCLSSSLARADIVMVQEMDRSGIKTKVVMSVKGKMMRTDNGTESSVIINTETGDMTSMMHEHKMKVEMKGEAMKAIQAQAGLNPEPPKLEATGEKEKIGEYECEIYTLKHGEVVSKMWVAKDYPNYDKLKVELAALKKLGGPAAEKTPDLPGMAIKTETTVAGVKHVTKLISLKEDAVPDSTFTPPADYKSPGAP